MRAEHAKHGNAVQDGTLNIAKINLKIVYPEVGLPEDAKA